MVIALTDLERITGQKQLDPRLCAAVSVKASRHFQELFSFQST